MVPGENEGPARYVGPTADATLAHGVELAPTACELDERPRLGLHAILP
jgi:hypothetical protein